MRTKTITRETKTCEKLAVERRDPESFTELIERLLAGRSSSTCGDAVRNAPLIWNTTDQNKDADVMNEVLQQGREQTDWAM